jgi:hypothetical protein
VIARAACRLGDRGISETFSGNVRFRPGDVIADGALSLAQGFWHRARVVGFGVALSAERKLCRVALAACAAFAGLASFWVVASHPRVPGHLSNSAWGEKSPP